jgi:hypothetical protein
MSLKSKLIAAALGVLNAEITKFKNLLKKPNLLIALKLAALAAVTPLLIYLQKLLQKKIQGLLSKSSDPALAYIQDPNNITDDDVNNYVQHSPDLQQFIHYVDQDFGNSLTSDILLQCEDPSAYDNQANALMALLGDQNLTEDDFMRVADEQSDLDLKVETSRIATDLAGLISKINGILPWAFMAYMIILKVKEFLTQNDYPSPYRGKYIQRLIRTLTAVLKARIRQEGQAASKIIPGAVGLAKDELNQINTMLNTLKKLDTIIVGSLLATFVYLRNRHILQQAALKSFAETAGAQSCIPTPRMLTDAETTPDPSAYTQTTPTLAQLETCLTSPDTNIVPHTPIEDKLLNLSCEVVLNPDVSINQVSGEDTATKALFENKTLKPFKILVSANDTLDVHKPFAVFDGNNIYPPLNGVVEKIDVNKIYTMDIVEPANNDIGEKISKLQDKYAEQVDIKGFIREFYIPSFYPVMLKDAPGIDPSINAEQLKKVIYKTGGVITRWNGIMTSYKAQIKDWQKRTNTIAGKDNVKTKCDQENVEGIKTELDNSDDTLFSNLNSDAGNGIAQARVTAADPKELVMIEFYFTLLQDLIAYYDQTSQTVVTFIKQIQDFLTNRYFLDQYSLQKIKDKVNSYCKELAQGMNFTTKNTPDFYAVMKTKYDAATNSQPNQKSQAAKDYLTSLTTKNTKLSSTQIDAEINLILFLFNFSLTIQDLLKTGFAPKITRLQETQNEGIWIEGYFNNLWKRYKALPGEIDQATADLDALNQVFESYSIINIDNEEYRWYTLDTDPCEAPDESDPYLSPKTKMRYSDKKYWLRYCAFATLASVVNPATAWSTGFPPPIGPIPFPTVYIPIKAFQAKWGMIVLGLTITGIYPFPWILFVNWSTQNHIPLADPVTLIQNEVDVLKKEITKQIQNFKKITLKNYLKKLKVDVDNAKAVVDELVIEKRNHKAAKPKRDRTVKPYIDIPRYTDALAKWNTNGAAIDERTLDAKRKQMVAETKYKIVQDAISGAPVKDHPDPTIKSMEKAEQTINSQFDKLDVIIQKVDDVLAPLPINTKPETANFAFTIKNPKPVINFAKDIDQTIAQGPLDKIIANFELNNADFMNTNYGSVLSKSVVNYKSYKATLSASMTTLIQKDPFPKYENLKPTNLPYMAFLLKSWAPKGAQTYGFPGGNPLPL